MDLDLGKPDDELSDAIGTARHREATEAAELLERFKEDRDQVRTEVRMALGYHGELASRVFALVVFHSDGLLRVKVALKQGDPAASFFNIAWQLPMELQMVLCHRLCGSPGTLISSKDSEVAFKALATHLLRS